MIQESNGACVAFFEQALQTLEGAEERRKGVATLWDHCIPSARRFLRRHNLDRHKMVKEKRVPPLFEQIGRLDRCFDLVLSLFEL